MPKDSEINIGRVDLQDVVKLVEKQFDEGADIVFQEVNYQHHTIYITRTLMLNLGGYESSNELVHQAFNTVNALDKTKTRFYFGCNFILGRHEGLWFDIHFPEDTSRLLEETQDIFIKATGENLRAREAQLLL